MFSIKQKKEEDFVETQRKLLEMQLGKIKEKCRKTTSNFSSFELDDDKDIYISRSESHVLYDLIGKEMGIMMSYSMIAGILFYHNKNNKSTFKYKKQTLSKKAFKQYDNFRINKEQLISHLG